MNEDVREIGCTVRGEGLKDEMERRRVLSSRKVYYELDIYI